MGSPLTARLVVGGFVLGFVGMLLGLEYVAVAGIFTVIAGIGLFWAKGMVGIGQAVWESVKPGRRPALLRPSAPPAPAPDPKPVPNFTDEEIEWVLLYRQVLQSSESDEAKAEREAELRKLEQEDADNEAVERERLARNAEESERQARWYVDPIGPAKRWVGPDGLLTLHLIEYENEDGTPVLRFCEDSTGLLVSPTNRQLAPSGLLIGALKGGWYYDSKDGDFSPGADLLLVPEPHNEYDDQAVAVFDQTGKYQAGYMNKMKARAYLKRLATGEELAAISLRGGGPGELAGNGAILVATPEVLAHVRGPRPPGSPPPAHLA